MGLKYEDLDEETRQFMIDEIQMDIAADKIYRSSYLNQQSQGSWPDYLLEAARAGSDDTLALVLRSVRAFNDTTLRQMKNRKVISAKVPHNAAELLAESEFNRYFARGLSRRAIANKIPRLEVFRAKEVATPRPDSAHKIGLLVDPDILLTDLRRSIGFETALGIPPGPGSGISVKIPKRTSNI